MNQIYKLYQIDCKKFADAFTGRIAETQEIIKFFDMPSNVITVNLKNNNYEQVYEGEIEEDNPYTVLESLFYKFNMSHPHDFKGHSMSVSDIVKLQDEYYYCSSVGFDKITCVE